jgi:flagellar basal-body rod modification protein FlgD
MTTPIGSNPTNIADALGRFPAAAPSNAGKSELGQDAFLKLLVAQMRYQDPSNPTDGTQFMAQTAQFTQVEKLSQLVTDQQTMMSTQRMLSAGTMVGRTVSYPGPDGAPVTGVVTSASFSGSDPTLRVGDMDVPLSFVTEVR